VTRRRTCDLAQTIDDPGIAGRLAGEQVLRNPLGASRLIGEDSRGTRMVVCAFAAGEVRIDPTANDRVTEGERTAGLENPRRHKQVGGVGTLGVGEAC
jgi:hypothetical protein